MPAQLIINADDFGATSAVNSAVVRARRHGVLTSASLMVTGAAAGEAVSIARDDPGLAVGLHVTLSDGMAALPREIIPDLVDEKSRFAPNPALAALGHYFNPRARRQLRSEIEAQFAAFAETGIPLSHVDGHQHMHGHPLVAPIVIELAVKYGAHGVRVPYDPFWANMRADRSRLGLKISFALGDAYLVSVLRRSLRGSGLARCEVSIGSLMSGKMSDGYVIKMLKSIDRRRVEVYFHPEEPNEAPPNPYGPNPGDLQALLSPALKQFIADNDYELTNYAGLRSEPTDERP